MSSLRERTGEIVCSHRIHHLRSHLLPIQHTPGWLCQPERIEQTLHALFNTWQQTSTRVLDTRACAVYWPWRLVYGTSSGRRCPTTYLEHRLHFPVALLPESTAGRAALLRLRTLGCAETTAVSAAYPPSCQMRLRSVCTVYGQGCEHPGR